jgi:hypothetical protein
MMTVWIHIGFKPIETTVYKLCKERRLNNGSVGLIDTHIHLLIYVQNTTSIVAL